MRNAIDETYRRRAIQEQYNRDHGIEAASIVKAVRDITDHVRMAAEEKVEYDAGREMPKDEALRLVKELESQMKAAAKNLEFEKAAALRDQVVELRRQLVGTDAEELAAFAAVAGRGGPVRYGRSQAGGRDRRRRYQK
jgi:excinuclease ABC subunit B